MIAQLTGVLVKKGPQEAILQVGGVGYRVFIPVSTFCRLGEPGAETRLLTHTHVREDTLALYGFFTETERTLFERLIGVSGVGPKLAINILSGIEPADLVDALGSADVARLTRVPGVGRKTAERLVLELREKIKALAPAEATEPHALTEDLLSALANLGYSRVDADNAVARVRQQDPSLGFEDLLRRTLRILSGR